MSQSHQALVTWGLRARKWENPPTKIVPVGRSSRNAPETVVLPMEGRDGRYGSVEHVSARVQECESVCAGVRACLRAVVTGVM